LYGTVAAARSSARASRDELGYLPRLCGVLFPSSGGGRIDISNFRHRGWTRAAEGGLVKHRRVYDLRHTYARWCWRRV
jgi:integrase